MTTCETGGDGETDDSPTQNGLQEEDDYREGFVVTFLVEISCLKVADIVVSALS